MPILPEAAYEFDLPEMLRVRQLFPDEKIEDPVQATTEALRRIPETRLRENSSAAILVGSRGICSETEVVKATVDYLKAQNVKPFIVPAMGSHGGGVAEEQRKIIEGYGFTEEAMGVPIIASMETVVIGKTKDGIPVHIDIEASKADYIIPINRIKLHTDFGGPIQSGFCKMLAIGLGKHNGCSRVHKEGFINFPDVIPSVASVIIEKCSIPFGVGIVENAHEHVHSVHVLAGKDFIAKEPELLALSKSMMPKLCFENIDVLVIEKIGKDVTGGGMDPNITGRCSLGSKPGYSGPSITRIVACDLTEATHHNATGVGYADFITKKLYDDIEYESTYANGIASGSPSCVKIPIIMENEEEALRAAIFTCPQIDYGSAKVVRIKDTLHLIDIEVSESLLPYCRENPQIQIL